MTKSEKEFWQFVFLIVPIVITAAVILGAWFSEGRAGFPFVRELGKIATSYYMTILLVFSWRFAFLSGRKRR